MVIKSGRMREIGHTAHMREMINAYKCFGGTPEGKTSLGRPRGTLKLECIVKKYDDRVQWQAFVNSVMKLQLHKKA
jgi:hypothetical protein